MMARLGLYACLGLVLLALQFTGSLAVRRPVAAGRTSVSRTDKKLGVVTPSIERMFLNSAGSDGVIDGYELTDMIEAAAKTFYRKKPIFSTRFGWAFVLLGESADPEKLRKLHNGLGVDGFALVVNKFKQYKGLFVKYDKDKSLVLEKSELQGALAEMGYNFKLDNRLNEIIKFYGNRTQTLDFEDFMCLVVKLDLLKELYPERIPWTTEIVRKFLLI